MLKIHVLLLVLFCISLAANNVLAKPAPSLELQIDWVSTPVADQVSNIEIRVLSHIDSENLTTSIELPESVQLLEGKRSFTGAIQKGVPQVFNVKVMFTSDSAGEIKAEARIGEKSATHFYAVGYLFLKNEQSGQSLKARSNTSESFTRTQRNGIGLREYRIPSNK